MSKPPLAAAAKKSPAKKSASKKKSRRKKSASKKTARKKTSARSVEAATSNPSLQKIDPEHRRRMIAETAYFIAEQRGFVGGSPLDDWLQAEVLVDRLLEQEES